MDNERFEQLKNSVIEAGQIMRGEIKPTRVFTLEMPERIDAPLEAWAVCLESDDHSLLVPRKLYPVTIVNGGIWVRDEDGEMTSCDTEDFLPVDFAPEVQQILAEAA